MIHFEDGRVQERPLGELAECVTEAGNPGNRLGVELARVELEHDLLRAGLELVDTSGDGLDSLSQHRGGPRFLPRVDAALCVLGAGQPPAN